MNVKKLCLYFLMVGLPALCQAQGQQDSLASLQQVPLKYLHAVDHKINQYSKRITGKTEKTLQKLARWENRIHGILQKVNPAAADKLFAPGQTTFGSLLQQFKDGKSITDGYQASYDHYRDQLATQLKYLEEKKALLNKKYLQPIAENKAKINALDKDVENSEALQHFIKERKQQLVQEALQYIGKSKYLQKINKESYYYTETLRNYKEIFNDKKKAEQTALTMLDKIPAFKKFMRENSMLASLFGSPGASGSPLGAGGLAGLQTRASVNSLIQERIAAGGPNAMQTIQQNIQQAQAELSKLKDKIIKAGGGNSDAALPDFKPNMQKTKTFMQRLQFGTDFQFQKSNSYLPGAANIGLSIGYKINDKSIAGIAVSYRLGLGKIDKIRFSNEGVGLRSFMDWKLKKQFFVSGGFEMNYNAAFKNIALLQEYHSWQQSGLVGISKKISMKTKLMKGSTIQILYDFLYRQHIPVSQPIVFRVGYKL
jgi:hypothetical protein